MICARQSTYCFHCSARTVCCLNTVLTFLHTPAGRETKPAVSHTETLVTCTRRLALNWLRKISSCSSDYARALSCRQQEATSQQDNPWPAPAVATKCPNETRPKEALKQLLLLLSSSLFPLCRVFYTYILRQTMSLGNTVFQLFCHNYLWCLYR